MSTPPVPGVYALLTDGTTVEIRNAQPDDLPAVRQMYAAMSRDNLYLRFFNVSPYAAEMAARKACRTPDSGHAALLVLLEGDVMGVACYEPAEEERDVAEIAFAVADHMHGRGVATLLLEHLVSLAQKRGVRAFTANALPGNTAMLRVFASAGLPAQQRVSGEGVVELKFPIPYGPADSHLNTYLDIVASREGHADVASLRHLLRPESIAIVCAGPRPGKADRALLRNIATAGFGGRLHVVNIPGRYAEGVPCMPATASLPAPVDLALVTAPGAAIKEVAERCGRHGVRSLLVTSDGLDAAAGADLLAICRRYGMRLAGPGSLGVAVPAIGLDATPARRHPVHGAVGLAVQSGGIGMAILHRLSLLGIGVSSFASLGDKYDISGNDLLMWWGQDPATQLAVLCLESFGNPRKFARTAQRLGRQMPILTLLADPCAATRPKTRAHAMSAATPLATREALFRQAGIIATSSPGELLDAIALLSTQPLPTGTRVAIVSNAVAAGRLAADICRRSGLRIATLAEPVQQRLRELLPPGADVAGPVDTTAAVGPAAFRTCLEETGAARGVDMLLAVTVTTALADLSSAVAAARPSKPLAAAVLGQPAAVRLLRAAKGRRQQGEHATAGAANHAVPAYASPESAARALRHAARYGTWRSRPEVHVSDIANLRPADARAVIDRLLTSRRSGGWLTRRDATELFSSYGVTLETTGSASADAGRIGVFIGVMQEPIFGPLVVLGAASTLTDSLYEYATRPTPLTVTDAAEMIREVRAVRELFGHTGAPGAQAAGLGDMLMRVSRLAEDTPEIAELDLGPIVTCRDGVTAVNARVRVTPAQPQDPFLRRLR